MSNNIDTLDHTEQARHTIRVSAGKDTNTGDYSITDVNVDGKIAARGYVWDIGSMSWIAQVATSGYSVNYDEIDITYTGTNPTTVVYKLAGDTVSTLTITYDGSNNITKVVRT